MSDVRNVLGSISGSPSGFVDKHGFFAAVRCCGELCGTFLTSEAGAQLKATTAQLFT